MCGRYSIINDLLQIRTFFSIDHTGDDRGMPVDGPSDFVWSPRYNAAPSQHLPVVIADGEGRRSLQFMRWGLVPTWAKPEEVRSVGSKMINARSETVAEKPSFKHAFLRRRCLVPANSFFEWKPGPGTGKSAVKTPYRIFLPDQPLFAFAGLFEEWREDRKFRAAGTASAPESVPSRMLTFSILTTEANRFMAGLHARMPVIVPPALQADWLDSKRQDARYLHDLLGSLHDGPALMDAQTVSRWINSPSHEGPDCWRPDLSGA
jgi:putative SOS response-associated peptidase YedK